MAIRRRSRLHVINLLVPSSFLVAIDALSFYLLAESETRAPFKMTLLLGYSVFLLVMNYLLPSSGTALIGVASPTFWGSKGSRELGGGPGELMVSLKEKRGPEEKLIWGRKLKKSVEMILP